MSFTIFQNEKTLFQAIKTRSLKSRKIDIFPKGLPMFLVQKRPFFHGFGSKMELFPFFLRQYRPGKCLLRYFRTIKTPFQAIKIRSSECRKIDFYSDGVNPCFWSKKGHFSMVLVQKWPFFHGFGSKMAIFPFSFSAIQTSKMSFTIFQNDKKAILGYKNKKFKKSKNDFYSDGVNPWFVSKNGHFSNFYFFRQCYPGKCLLRYSRTKKRLSKL